MSFSVELQVHDTVVSVSHKHFDRMSQRVCRVNCPSQHEVGHSETSLSRYSIIPVLITKLTITNNGTQKNTKTQLLTQTNGISNK